MKYPTSTEHCVEDVKSELDEDSQVEEASELPTEKVEEDGASEKSQESTKSDLDQLKDESHEDIIRDDDEKVEEDEDQEEEERKFELEVARTDVGNEETEGKTSILKSALQLLDEIDAEIGKCFIPSKSALQLLAEI